MAIARSVIALWWALHAAAWGQSDTYQLQVDVQQKDRTFVTQARFELPLQPCQAWRYLTDYDAATNIPGIVSSRTTRLDEHRVRIERVMKDRILLFPIQMRSVMEYKEVPEQGTDFLQMEGEAKSHKGSWRLEARDAGTLFLYSATSEPDSSLPMSVIQYFVHKRLHASFAAMAEQGASRKNTPCH